MHSVRTWVAVAVLLALVIPRTAAPCIEFPVRARGFGATVYPAAPAAVTLESQRVVFVQRERQEFDVTETLVFRNDTKKAITRRLGFPVGKCDWDVTTISELSRQEQSLVGELKVRVAGKEVPLVLMNDVKGKNIYQGRWLAIYTFAATFPERARTLIENRYRIAVPASATSDLEFKTGDVDFETGVLGVKYIFSTGSLWNGYIRKAEFVFDLNGATDRPRFQYGGTVLVDDEHQPGRRCSIGSDDASYEFLWTPRKRGGVLRVIFHDISPTSDIGVYFTQPKVLNPPAHAP